MGPRSDPQGRERGPEELAATGNRFLIDKRETVTNRFSFAFTCHGAMSAFGTKRTSLTLQRMSALGVKRTSGGGCFSFICALSASRGHADERAIHLLRNALHGAGAYAEFAGNLVDAFT